jgi:fluoroacetyl-CoA thioesterase
MVLAPGLRSVVRIVVADTDTAVAMGSGDVPVLGTPRLLALAEAAAAAAVAPGLEPGQTSVGTQLSWSTSGPARPGRRSWSRPSSPRWTDGG